MDLTVVRASALLRTPWMNGMGWTREVARSPGPGPWSWRLSLAESDSAARFSVLPGIQRELVLVRGNGLALRFDDGEELLVRGVMESVRFGGDRPVVGAPIDGPTEQLNLMWRADIVDATTVIPLDRRTILRLRPGRWWAIHVVDGTVRLGGGHGELGPGDSSIVAAARDPETIELTVTGSALAARIDPVL